MAPPLQGESADDRLERDRFLNDGEQPRLGDAAIPSSAGRDVPEAAEGQLVQLSISTVLRRFQLGAVRVAAEAGVPVVPTAIEGTRFALGQITQLRRARPGRHDLVIPLLLPVLLPVRVQVTFGAPFSVDPDATRDRDSAISGSRRLYREVHALRESLRSPR